MPTRRSKLCAWLVLAGLGVIWINVANSQPFTVTGPGVNTNDFRVTIYANGLDFPMGMAVLPDNSLLVGINSGSSLFSATGQILHFVDANEDGVAEGPATLVADNLPDSQTGLAVAGELVIVGGRDDVMVVLRRGAAPGDPFTEQGRLFFDYASGWLHRNSAIAVRRTPNQTNAFDLLFQIGSFNNVDLSTQTVSLTNQSIVGATGTLVGDALYSLTLVDHGTNVTATNLIQLATGLRNAAGFQFHPVTGDLYLEDNGIDGLVDVGEAHSADELNVIARTNVGGATIEDFGFPTNYTAYRTGTIVGGAGIQPLMVFQPLQDPTTGAESEGPNQIAVAPPGFPSGLNTGVFVTFHGHYGRGGLDNEENPLVYADLASSNYFHFIEGQQIGIGHLDGIVATRDSLFLADLVTTGSPFSGPNAGVIYQIKALNTPVPPILAIQTSGTQSTIIWDRGKLQQADAVDGPWTDTDNAFNPHPVDLSAPQRFFRAVY